MSGLRKDRQWAVRGLSQTFLMLLLIVSGCDRSQNQSSAQAASTQATAPSANAQPTRTNPTDGAVMVYIPAGDFFMGDDDVDWIKKENPRHTVKLSGFWIYKNLVTVAEYKAFCKATNRQMPKEPPGNCPVFGQDPTGNPISYITTGGGANFNPNWSKEDHPIIDVSSDDASAYAQWAQADLPTEAQWEKAARGTDGRKYPWGDNFDASKLWCSKNGFFDSGGTHSVGELGISPYGCTDMEGNVEQWCKDWYDPDFWNSPQAAQADPENQTSGNKRSRVTRGGSWDYYNAGWFRCAVRGSSSAGPSNDLGFRCVVRADSATTEPAGAK